MKYTRVSATLTMILVLLTCITGLWATGATAKSLGQPVKGFDIQEDAGRIVVSVATVNPPKIRYATLQSPRLIWLNITDAYLPEGPRMQELEHGVVSSVKISQYSSEPPTVRLVIMLREKAGYRVVRSNSEKRVAIEVWSSNSMSAPKPAAQTEAKPVALPVAKPMIQPLPAVSLSVEPVSAKSMSPSAPARYAKGDAAPAKGNINLDFRNTDIHDVFKALALQSGLNIIVSESAKGNVTVSLHNTSVEEALQMLSRMANLDFRKVGANYLVGSTEEIRKAVASGGVTEIYKLKYLKAAEVQALIEKAYPYLTVQGQAGGTVVVIGDSDDVRKALEMLALVDKAEPNTPVVEAPAEKMHKVCRLDYLNAAKAVDSLKKVFPDLSVAPGPEPFSPPPARFTPLAISNGSGRSGSSGSSGFGSSGMGGGSSSGNWGSSQVNPLQFEQQTPEAMRSRSVILYGPKDMVEAAAEILKDIDLPPAQVMIEAKVMDISPEFTSDLGVEWSWGTEDAPGSGRFTFTEDKSGSNISFGSFFRSPEIINAKLSALVREKKARILANPRIAVLDSEEANIFIGDILRFQVLSENTATGTLYTVEEFPVGIALLVRPRVHNDGSITMKVHPVVSRVTGVNDGLPQTGSRESDSTIRIKEGETVVIGGLLQEEDIKTLSKIPLLGDLPILGKLFSSTSTKQNRSEVTIFITPRIVRTQ